MVFRYRAPRHPIQQLRDEMDRLFSGVMESAGDSLWPRPGRGHPAVNVWETPETIFAELELPGVKNEAIDISVIGGELSLKIERPEIVEEGVTYHRRERPAGTFTRVVRLPSDVDSERVEAELRNGVLTIKLPKAESAKPRKIVVSTGG